MSNHRIPVFLPRYIDPPETDCDCRKTKLDMEFKAAILHQVAKQGETVQKGAVLFEGEVEKISFEVLSPAEGLLVEICFSDGDYCTFNEALAYIENTSLNHVYSK
ncbi:MAG: hypothetical protein PQJ58_12395 [Spirochaetales bacterium]|nr:hypothetical protein [Spirochaetales bacterium]